MEIRVIHSGLATFSVRRPEASQEIGTPRIRLALRLQEPDQAVFHAGEGMVDQHVAPRHLQLELHHRRAAGGTSVVCTSVRGGEVSEPWS